MSFRAMTGPRWRFLSNDPGTGHRTVCEASGKLSPAHAKIIGHLLSDDLGTQLYVVAPGRTEHNPADHVAYPRWIVYEPAAGYLVATLSGLLSAGQAKKAAKNIATWLGYPVELRDEFHGGKVNPSSDQPIYDGQIWHNFQTNAYVKVINSDDRIVVFMDQDTDERGRETPKEFRWTHKLVTGRKANPKGRKWSVKDAAGRVFWQGTATDRDEALMMAERSAAGQSDPPDPWLALPNPSFRVSGTIEEITDAAPVVRRGPGRPRKVRVAPLDLAPPSEAVPFEVPGEAVQGGDLQPGDRVTVPYSGRASYFGRAVKRTRESGIFESYTYENDQRMAFVRVNRGKNTVETHAFPVDQVRLHGKTFAQQAAVKRSGRPTKLARLTWKAHGSLEKAEVMLEKARAEHAATEAVAMELYPQHEAQPGRPRGRTAQASRAYLNARAKLRRLTERVDLLKDVVRSLGGGQDYGQATGTDPWATNRRRRTPNPIRHKYGAFQNARTIRGAKRKRNPRGSERERAVKTFRMWHEFAPHKITRMKGPDRLIPITLVKLGDIRSIDYISDKYEGRPVTYTHKTDRPRPVLATDPDGQNLHIIGGRVKITGDGLIH